MYPYLLYHSQLEELKAPPASKRAVESIPSVIIGPSQTGGESIIESLTVH